MAYYGQRYKTGQKADTTGRYEFDGYTDGTNQPPPTANERNIPLSAGETFPPINSCNKGAWWKYIG